MTRRGRWLMGIAALAASMAMSAGATPEVKRFPAGSGGKLILDLQSGGSVEIVGTGGSSVEVSYTVDCSPPCEVAFEPKGSDLRVTSKFTKSTSSQRGDATFSFKVPSRYDVEIGSNGGELSIDGVEGKFTGKTMGGGLKLRRVKGEARLTTMGGEIELTDSDLDGALKTMGGEVTFENVVGDVRGSSMGGQVRYKNVRQRGGTLASPDRIGGLDRVGPDTLQISTMGGEIKIGDAPEGADLHTMGGDIEVQNARRFVRAKTMGGNIDISSVDGWVNAITMGGNIDTKVTGSGGDVTLQSMSGEIDLGVPPGFGMDLDLEIAFTRNSGKDYKIVAPGGLTTTVTPEWDHEHGTPRKYIRMSGAVNGGGHAVKIRTINGGIEIKE